MYVFTVCLSVCPVSLFFVKTVGYMYIYTHSYMNLIINPQLGFSVVELKVKLRKRRMARNYSAT